MSGLRTKTAPSSLKAFRDSAGQTMEEVLLHKAKAVIRKATMDARNVFAHFAANIEPEKIPETEISISKKLDGRDIEQYRVTPDAIIVTYEQYEAISDHVHNQYMNMLHARANDIAPTHSADRELLIKILKSANGYDETLNMAARAVRTAILQEGGIRIYNFH
jgi:hypothetical protein